MTRYWLGVVQRAHVLRGVELGIAQTNHGQRAGMTRLARGDGFVFYSPKTDYPTGDPLKQFTAIGRVVDDEAYQAADGDFQPWRRRIHWDPTATAAPIAPLIEVLDFTRDTANWGYQLRRGLIEITKHDFGVVAEAMGAAVD